MPNWPERTHLVNPAGWLGCMGKLRCPRGQVDPWRSHSRIDMMRMKPRELSAVLTPVGSLTAGAFQDQVSLSFRARRCPPDGPYPAALAKGRHGLWMSQA